MDLSWYEYLFIILAGIFTGVINTLAGSGSLITLPIFIFMCGLPAPVANGTNRIGVVLQSLVGFYSYKRSGQTILEGAQWLVWPSVLGAIIGAWLATQLDREMMYRAIGFLMVFMLLVMFFKPSRWIRASEVSAARNRSPLNLLIFFLIGIYGGFIQAGVGIFLLAAMVLSARYSLTAANGIKLLLVLVFNIPALIIFFWYNQVHIGWGLLLAVCQSIGAVLGVRFVARVPNANVWIHRLLILIVLASASKFLGVYDWVIAQLGG
jgi:uncharacterized membrane protein YfcA